MANPNVMMDMALKGRGGRQPETKPAKPFIICQKQTRFRCSKCQLVLTTYVKNFECPMCGAPVIQEQRSSYKKEMAIARAESR